MNTQTVSPPQLEFVLRPRQIVRACWFITAVIVSVATYLMYIKYGRGRDFVYGLTERFDMDREWGIPSLFSGVLLLFCGGLFATAWMATRDGANRSRMWLLLALCFVFLSIDEVFSVHEQLIVPMRDQLTTAATGDYAWMVLYGAAVLLIGFAFHHVWRRQTLRVRVLLGVAAAVYVTGAIGIDVAGDAYFSANGDGLAYMLIVELEETFELAGVIILMQTLFGIIQESGCRWQVALRGQDVD